MSDDNQTEIPAENYPKIANYTFDLEEKLTSILALRSQMGSDAFTAGHLGTEREGHGVLISDNGLGLTIGYLITEADTIWLVDATGVATPAHTVGYDQETGFGLVQALGKLTVPHLALGESSALRVGDPIIIGGSGGIRTVSYTHLPSPRD